MKSKKQVKKTVAKKSLPRSLKPLLWWLRWEALNPQKDKEDIIVSVINEGALDQWRWIKKIYGTPMIRRVLARRLVTEFHPESRNLASLIFGAHFSHARRSSRAPRTKNISSPRPI